MQYDIVLFLKNKASHFWGKVFGPILARIRNHSGMGTIEVVIIIAVLVALALIFRNFIMDMAGMVFDRIKDKIDTIINTL